MKRGLQIIGGWRKLPRLIQWRGKKFWERGGGCHNCCKPTLPHLCLTVEEHRVRLPFLAHKEKKKHTLTLIYLSTNVLPYVREAPKSRRQIWKDENERLSKHRPSSSCSKFNWFGIQLAEKIMANLLVGVINSQWKDFIAHKMQYKGTDCLGITLHRLDCHIVFCFILNAIMLQIITL